MNEFHVVMALFLKSSSFGICVLWFSGVATGFFLDPIKIDLFMIEEII